jgi:uncharacterized protein (TIGR02466 family)
MNRQDVRPEMSQAFGTPVVSFDLPDAGRVNEELRRVVLRRRESDRGVVRSNVNGWHSSEDFIEWGGEGARMVSAAFAQICGALTEPPPQSEHDVGWIIRMWANASEAGASNQLHCHPGAFWSGVYYVCDGGYTSDSTVGGELVLHSPHEALSSMYAPDVHIRLPDGGRLSNRVIVRPRAGRGILFPSWLMHSVEPYFGTATRVSIALNFSLSSRIPVGGI